MFVFVKLPEATPLPITIILIVVISPCYVCTHLIIIIACFHNLITYFMFTPVTVLMILLLLSFSIPYDVKLVPAFS